MKTIYSYLPTDENNMFSRVLKGYSYLYVIFKSCSGSDLVEIFSVYHIAPIGTREHNFGRTYCIVTIT